MKSKSVILAALAGAILATGCKQSNTADENTTGGTNVTSTAENIKDGVTNAWANTKEVTTNALADVKEGTTNAWANTKYAATNAWTNIKAVSYTHLDVYKRQGCNDDWSQCCARQLHRRFFHKSFAPRQG